MDIDESMVGSVNAIVYRKEAEFWGSYDYICNNFRHFEKVVSGFDLTSNDMIEVELTKNYPFSSSVIYQCIFLSETEKIILEYFQDSLIVEHILDYNQIKTTNGLSILKHFFKVGQCTLILGYELSIEINSFNKSFEEHISDKSLHPLLIVEKENEELNKKEYFLHGADLAFRMNNNLELYYSELTSNPASARL